MLEVEHIAKRLHLRRMVIKHQQDAGIGQDDEKIKRDPAHTPRVAVANGIPIDLRRMKVQKDVGKHAQRPVPWRVVVFVPEDRRVNLRLRRIFQTLDLFFCLRWNVGL